jgi:hypothetical protein
VSVTEPSPDCVAGAVEAAARAGEAAGALPGVEVVVEAGADEVDAGEGVVPLPVFVVDGCGAITGFSGVRVG